MLKRQDRARMLRTTMGLIVALSCVPAGAHAAPMSSLDAKKAEQEALTAELEQMRLDLASQLADYAELGRQLERAKRDIVDITAQLAVMDAELAAAEEALAIRAVQLYRGDRLEMFRLLFTASSLQDLWVRSNYLAKINYRDARLINQVRLARSENLWLREGLNAQVARLEALKREADATRTRIEQELEAQEKRAAELRVDIARLMWAPGGATAPAGGFDAQLVISEATFRDSAALSEEQIQAFLEELPGTLARSRAKDHNGAMKTVARMVAEAATAWGVNPKVILVTMQKEQSLLERANPSQNAYDWAMGCGKADSRTFYQYKGFGKQIWFGAQKLAKNGERWKPGVSMRIDGATIRPANAATYSLFKYTPHFRGTMSFWMLYWRYFGDPTV